MTAGGHTFDAYAVFFVLARLQNQAILRSKDWPLIDFFAYLNLLILKVYNAIRLCLRR
jgi:hypothetical protein